ncbi:hypothetical protein IJ579_05820 [bacterium]|nr:hypothetical protein [bacterium]MBQ8460778.1 hypothetical protein [bacterium]MBR1425061.1 hypothetical protein [bacterium]
MQVQSINAYNNQPSFKAIKYQDGLLNNKNRKAVSDFIANRLNEIDPSDRLKRSYVKRAKFWGYDILFSKGEKKNSVRVDVVSTLLEEKAAPYNGVPIYDWTHVGTYSKPEEFNIQHFNNTYRQSEKSAKKQGCVWFGIVGVLFTALAGVVGYGIKKDLTSAERKPNTTIVAKDSLKTDSIKPILEDSFKLGKKIIKK